MLLRNLCHHVQPAGFADCLISGGRSDVLKEAEFILTDLGPCLRVICRPEDSWLACTSLKAAWPPPTDLRTRLSLLQESPCSTSVGSQRLGVFMLSPSAKPLLLTHNIWVYSISHFSHPCPYPSLLFTPHYFPTATRWNGTSPMTETVSFTTWWHSNYLFVMVFAFH